MFCDGLVGSIVTFLYRHSRFPSLFQLVVLVVRAFFYIDISVISESFSELKVGSPLKALRQAIGVKSFRNTQSLIEEGCLKDFSQIRRHDWCLLWARTV